MKKSAVLFFGLAVFFCSAQQPETVALKAVEQDTLTVGEDALPFIDTTATVIDGRVFFEKKDKKYRLKDHAGAARIDSLWLKRLYAASSWYDTIYNTVTELPYEEDAVYDELPVDTLKARLERLDRKTPFHIEYNPDLENLIKRFLFKRKTYMEELMTLGAFYFTMFEQELRNYNVPLEVKYLPIVESALNPRAKSRAGAVGLWQFIYTTGKVYGLDVNSYVDERSDPIKATRAAARFLANLYDMFGDWDLALAAYNSGPGNVSKAMRRSEGSRNYWNLRPFLPRETAGYVPAFYATLYIFEYAREHGFKPQQPEILYFETDTVHVKQLLTFDQLSKVLDVEPELLQFFNPAYYLDAIPFIAGKDYPLRLPRRLVGKFVANEDAIYAYAKAEQEKREKPLPELFETDSKLSYKVKSGDFLGKIAKKYGVSVSSIKQWNGLRSDKLSIGQRLVLHPKEPDFTRDKTASGANAKTYTVKAGDTLQGIAKKFPGISVQNIKDWNNISGDNVKAGTKLKMCSC